MIRKRFYRIPLISLFILAAAGIFPACSDFFDIDPENGVDHSNMYQNVEEMHSGAMGIYSALAPEVHKFLLWGSARADMVTTGEGRDIYVSEFVNNNVTTLNPYTDYSFLYKVIARCNHHLEQGIAKEISIYKHSKLYR